MIQFLKRYASQLGITHIEVTDSSLFHCPTNHHFSIPLEMSRQLEGQYPYYVQFGLNPSTNLII